MNVVVKVGNDYINTNQHILDLVSNKKGLSPAFVLVPDRFTLQAERMLLRNNPRLLNTRVVTFSMLYNIIAEELNMGDMPANVIDKTSAVLYLWKAIKSVQGQLGWFQKSVSHYDFAEKIFNTINQMKSSFVDFDEVQKTAKSNVAKKKFYDISIIYKKYLEIIGENIDSAGMLSYLIQNIKQSNIIKQADIFVCGFENFSPARLGVLSEITNNAKSTTIGVSGKEIKSQLSGLPFINIPDVKIQNNIKTAKCETYRQEAEVVAEKIIKLINDGNKPEDIMVLLSDFENAAPVWNVVFSKYNIPMNIDVDKRLSDLAEAKYLRDLLELAINNNAENTLSVLFNQCSGLGDEIFEIENKIIKQDLRASKVPEVKPLKNTKNVSKLCTELSALVENEKLKNILDKIGSIMSTEEIKLREFISLFWTLCSATKVSNIPLYVDRVLIISPDEWVPVNVKHLFIANVTEENFPKGQDDNDILQEIDLIGTKITPTPKLQRERNKYHSDLVLSAGKNILLSGEREDFETAVIVKQNKIKIFDNQDNISVSDKLFFDKKSVRTTMIEKFYSCPYLNFIDNGLRIKPREVYSLGSADIGNIIHKAIEEYFKIKSVDKAIEIAFKEMFYDYKPIVDNLKKEIKFIISKLEQDLKSSAFDIYLMEYNVKRKLKNGLDLVGRIDRVDKAINDEGETCLAILDYKTGRVGSVPGEIYTGQKLQLPIYASALADKGKIAGAGYISLASGFAEDKKSIELKGFVDKSMAGLFSSEMVNPKSRQLLDSEVIFNIRKYADKMVDEAVDKILSGIVKANPVNKNVCEYCPVKFICDKSKNAKSDDKERITFKSFGGDKK